MRSVAAGGSAGDDGDGCDDAEVAHVARCRRSGTTGKPLVALHTWRDEDQGYARLSEALGGQLVYSLLQPDPADGPLPRRVDAWVDHHEATFESLGLEPPYRLVGFSFGGVLTVELARRLHRRGLELEYVGLVDTTRPRLNPLSNREFVWHHLAAAADMDHGQRTAYLSDKARLMGSRNFPRTATAAARALQALGLREPDRPPGIAKPSDPLQVSIHVSYLNYRGDPLPFPVHVYVTEESKAIAQAPALRWLPHVHGGFTLTDIAGEHLTVFAQAHVGSLASAMAPHLGLELHGPASDTA